MNDAQTRIFSAVEIVDNKGTTVYRDYLGEHYLVEGEIVRVACADGLILELPIKLYQTTPKEVTEFGGAWHGFKHPEYSIRAYVEVENPDIDPTAIVTVRGKHRLFLGLSDGIRIERRFPPLGNPIPPVKS